MSRPIPPPKPQMLRPTPSQKVLVVKKKETQLLAALGELEDLQRDLNQIEGATLSATQTGADCLSIMSEIDSIKSLVENRSIELYDSKHYLQNIKHVIYLQRWMKRVLFRSRLWKTIRDLLKKAKAGEIPTTPAYQQIVVLKEVLNDERDFLRVLNNFQEMFVLPFEKFTFPDEFFEAFESWKSIFFKIQHFGEIFCEGVSHILHSTDDAAQAFSKLAKDMKSQFKDTMLPYARSQDAFANIVEDYRNTKGDTEFNKIFDEAEQKAGDSFRAFVVSPVQRIPKYLSFSRTMEAMGLLVYDEEEEKESEILQNALNQIFSCASLQGSQKLLNLTAEIDFPHLGLIEPGRTLIHSGFLYKCWESRDWKKWSLVGKKKGEGKDWAPAPRLEPVEKYPKLFFILTNDFLLFCSPRRGFGPKYHFISFFNLYPSSEVLEPKEQIEGFPHTFEISMNSRKGFVIAAETKEEKKIWSDKIKQAVDIQTERLINSQLTFPASDGLKLVKQAGIVLRKDRIFWTRYLMKFKGNSFFFFEDSGDYSNYVDVLPNVSRYSVRCAEKQMNRKFAVEFFCEDEKSVFLCLPEAHELERWLFVWQKSITVHMEGFPQYADRLDQFEDIGLEELIKGHLASLKDKLAKEKGILAVKGLERTLAAWDDGQLNSPIAVNTPAGDFSAPPNSPSSSHSPPRRSSPLPSPRSPLSSPHSSPNNSPSSFSSFGSETRKKFSENFLSPISSRKDNNNHN